ncbi:HPr family phosphocarrier protein [Saccharothrix longispora]|uniref:HPr family phosphocarrier protein n=1 Tax=Saccharothrix longispora TaxID=33920 RepID=UPI0028FD88F5|nr:HPr family phosphocarrier protein [Saccharothrix longispora]MDU0292298.1 HPr family phosphocarrier protein [Saccharothrix longispora]
MVREQDAAPRPATPERVPRDPREACLWYGRRFGWRVVAGPAGVRLVLAGGTVGFLVPADLAAAVLARFDAVGVPAPAVVRPDGRVVFLADADDRWWSQGDVLAGVVFLRAPTEVPLPPTPVCGGRLCWARPVEAGERWLPVAEGVLSAIRSALEPVRRPAAPWPARGVELSTGRFPRPVRRERLGRPFPHREEEAELPSTRVTIGSPVGLHARPAKLLVEAARKQGGKVRIGRSEDALVDAASILAVMSLGVKGGEEVVLTVESDQADTALAELSELLSTDLDAAPAAGG